MHPVLSRFRTELSSQVVPLHVVAALTVLSVFTLGYLEVDPRVVNYVAIGSYLTSLALIFGPLFDKRCNRVVDPKHRTLVCSALAATVVIQLGVLVSMLKFMASGMMWSIVTMGQLVTVLVFMGFHAVLKLSGSDA